MLFGCVPDKLDTRDVPFLGSRIGFIGAALVIEGVAPRSFDLRSFDTPSVQVTPSCVGHAVVAACAMLAKIAGTPIPFPSAAFAHKGARILDKMDRDAPLQNVGCSIRNALQWLRANGIVDESTCPEDVDTVNDVPTLDMMQAGDSMRVESFYRIADGSSAKNDIRIALAANRPTIFAMRVSDEFVNNGMGVFNGPDGPPQNGHAMLIVGYDESLDAFIVRNQWGQTWGDNGYCLISADFVNAYTFDKWVITIAPKVAA